ncbi:hypothetical protein [Nocardioides mesophilus]|uniref:Uncharacterized protein n=1 Tax=Nocardioides mesophilus TaxID=433659 RepID=A0A7G9RFU9_9ACTN|nr:hypothetical protein [Nocardioides mesophilus]QNN54474.1 hypothetical protein H9L09_09275 [Nocardioides mesophilus]
MTDQTTGQRIVEIHLEELGQHSWVKALANTLLSMGGSAQFRFVARTPGPDRADAPDHLVGATFPMMRWQDLNDEVDPNGWLELARERLRELDRQLVDDGWVRRPDTGRHWWSLRYSRTTS